MFENTLTSIAGVMLAISSRILSFTSCRVLRRFTLKREIAKNAIKITRGRIGGTKITPVMPVNVMKNTRKRFTQCMDRGGVTYLIKFLKLSKENCKNASTLSRISKRV